VASAAKPFFRNNFANNLYLVADDLVSSWQIFFLATEISCIIALPVTD
jgi:hypothetical protein